MKLVEKNGAVEVRSQESGRLFGVYDPEQKTLSIRRNGETVVIVLSELMENGEGLAEAQPAE